MSIEYGSIKCQKDKQWPDLVKAYRCLACILQFRSYWKVLNREAI